RTWTSVVGRSPRRPTLACLVSMRFRCLPAFGEAGFLGTVASLRVPRHGNRPDRCVASTGPRNSITNGRPRPLGGTGVVDQRLSGPLGWGYAFRAEAGPRLTGQGDSVGPK